MALEDDIRILSGVELFEELSRDQLRLLAFGVEGLRLDSGEELYSEGQQADCAYVVASGTVVLSRQGDGERRVLAEVGRGALLGELALITETTRPTAAVAQTEVHLLRLSRAMFRRILEEYPEVAAAMHGRISENLDSLVRQIVGLGSRFS